MSSNSHAPTIAPTLIAEHHYLRQTASEAAREYRYLDECRLNPGTADASRLADACGRGRRVMAAAYADLRAFEAAHPELAAGGE